MLTLQKSSHSLNFQQSWMTYSIQCFFFLYIYFLMHYTALKIILMILQWMQFHYVKISLHLTLFGRYYYYYLLLISKNDWLYFSWWTLTMWKIFFFFQNTKCSIINYLFMFNFVRINIYIRPLLRIQAWDV